jgi:hypothetical protein
MVPPMRTGWPMRPSIKSVGRGTGELVVHRDERVVRREGSGAALPMDQQRLQIPVHHVLLHLRRSGIRKR